MKRMRIRIALLLTMMVLLGGCTPKVRTQAPILVMKNGGYMVLLNGSEPVTVSLEKGTWPKDLTSGDIVEITWSGMVMETYPGQASIEKCRKVADSDLSKIDGELLVHLSSMGWSIVE